ncbi:hypothetical protein BDL97_11G011800 [Sphagnum fallax]|nr:hypothetical protein BDL97_11G011800 [Sphagnum fallax]
MKAICRQLIQLLWRAARSEEVEPYIQRAEKGTPTASSHAGLNFCKGLLACYSNNPCEAHQMLNNARADLEWGKKAIFIMVEIYLNIDNELGWEESNLDGPTVVNEDAIRAAHKLLSENSSCRDLEPPRSTRQAVLECYATMATRQKHDIESALMRLQKIAREDTIGLEKEKISNMLAMATGLTMLKQVAKAKNQLRAIDRMPFKWDDADAFERAWLMLANIHMQAGKQEAVEELCKKCIKYNKACSKAWELLGLMMEKNHMYTEAINFYKNAWKCQKQRSPAIGYRLAFAYLKDKQYIKVICVCHKVLQACPHYPKIRKEVLDKARVHVRP